jgi:hypothetical protein
MHEHPRDSADIVFVDFAGTANPPEAQRKTNCIFVSPWQAGIQCVAVVVLQNIGNAAGSAAVQFYLNSVANPLGGQQGMTAFAIGQSAAIALYYTPPDAYVGPQTLYAQIQTSATPPFPDPTDLTQPYNASKSIIVLSAPGDTKRRH